jgi:hypothetical protein
MGMDKPAIDYRALLKKYMDTVLRAEGITFIDERGKDITDEEYQVLAAMRNELDKDAL